MALAEAARGRGGQAEVRTFPGVGHVGAVTALSTVLSGDSGIRAAVLAFIRSLLIDRAQSEEVTQEVFLEVWQVASRFDPSKGNAFTWIRGMARLRAIDRIRSTQSGRERDIRIGIRDYGPEYDEVAETIERERIDAAMQSLTELQREAISLSYYGEYSCAEISGMLSVPLGTVKTRLRDGLIRLRREMSVLV